MNKTKFKESEDANQKNLKKCVKQALDHQNPISQSGDMTQQSNVFSLKSWLDLVLVEDSDNGDWTS